MASNTRPAGLSMDSSPVIQSADEWWEANALFLERVARIQASWLSSWWLLQFGWARGLGQRTEGVPAWMVWHNGTEQLA